MNTRSAMAGETDLEVSANDAIVAAAAFLLPYLRTHVGMSMWLITRKQGELCEVVVADGTGYRLRNGDVLRWDESPCDLAGGGTIFSASTAESAEHSQLSFVRRMRVGAFLCVPLKRSSGELIGALWALDPDAVDPTIVEVMPFLEVQATLVSQLLEKSEESIRYFKRAEVAERESTIDSLTGMLNQRGLDSAVSLAERRSRRYGGAVSAIRFTLQHLDYVQRNLGDRAEDAYVELFSKILAKTVRITDGVARVGRGEFVVLLPNTDSLGAEALRRRIQVQLDNAGVVVAVATSERDFDGEGVMGAVQRTEAELRSCQFAAMEDEETAPPISLMMHLSATELSAHTLREAITNREFQVRYQPIFEVASGRPIGVDARIHWTSSAIGEVSPDIFLPAVDGVGLGPELGEYFQALVFRVASRLPANAVVTIRPFRSELVSERFADQFLSAIRRAGLRPERFAIEVSLPLSFSANADVLLTLGMLRHAGVRVIFDGLGQHMIDGADLLDFPVDVLKIDHTIAMENDPDSSVAEKISELVNFARSFGLGTIIEGIETPEEFAIVRASGCEFVQGHLIGPSMTTDRLLARLSSIES